MSTRLKRLFVVFLLAAVAIIAVWWWHLGKESTDDAFVERDIIYLRPKVSGQLIDVSVTDHQAVKAGDVLARIDPAPFRIAEEAARARVAQAESSVASARAEKQAFEADLQARQQDAKASVEVANANVVRQQRALDTLNAKIEQAQRNVERYQALAKRQQVSQQTLEDARTSLQTLQSEHAATEAAIVVARREVGSAQAKQAVVNASTQRLEVLDAAVGQAQASLQQAQADLHQAQLNLKWTRIEAPVDGWTGEIQAKTGSNIGPDSTLAILVSGAPWVKANFKETQLGDMHVGDRVDLAVDAYPDVSLSGHVVSFQPGTGSRFALLPPENATGNFVKVVQRLPVRIQIDSVPDGVQLWPGMSVVPTVYLDSADESR
ncbi:MAG: HlyD family secretion protein [Marinobacter sp.]|nr:HlyD family secretion protein [Marinobacter sp.]